MAFFTLKPLSSWFHW